MQITIYSVVMTVLWSSLLIVLFSILQRSRRLLDMCSVPGVTLLYLFCIIRMFIPMEFHWTVIIPSFHIYSTIQKFWNLNVPLFFSCIWWLSIFALAGALQSCPV